MLRDPNSGQVLGDSFDIAIYLDEAFPEPGGTNRLFPADSTRTGLDYESPYKDSVFFAPITTNAGSKHSDYARFNLHVDTTFSANMGGYGYYMPFNPPTADAVKALMAKRAHLRSWEDTKVPEEAKGPMKESFKAGLGSLAAFLARHEGPYLEGREANYADIVVGGWLNMLFSIMPREDWEDLRRWHGGVFARLHDALQNGVFRVYVTT
jgi:glutathione S-transferase